MEIHFFRAVVNTVSDYIDWWNIFKKNITSKNVNKVKKWYLHVVHIGDFIIYVYKVSIAISCKK